MLHSLGITVLIQKLHTFNSCETASCTELTNMLPKSIALALTYRYICIGYCLKSLFAWYFVMCWGFKLRTKLPLYTGLIVIRINSKQNLHMLLQDFGSQYFFAFVMSEIAFIKDSLKMHGQSIGSVHKYVVY